MAYSFGGGVRPELGRTDFTPFLQGSVQGAQMQARGAENMAAGVSQFLQKAGEGVKAYQENKAINTMFNSTIDDAIKLNEEGGGELARVLKIADPSDRAAWAAGIKSLGGGDKKEGSMAVRNFMMQMAQQEAQRKGVSDAIQAGGDPMAIGQRMVAAGADPRLVAQFMAASAGPPPVEDPAAVRALAIRAQEAGLQPGSPEYRQFMLYGGAPPPDTTKPSEAEAQIERLVSTGISREDAIGIRDGRLKVVIDPVTGDTSIVDVGTGTSKRVASPEREDRPMIEPPKEGETLAEMAEPATGIGASFLAAAQRVVGLGGQLGGKNLSVPGAQEVIQFRQFFDASVQELVRSLSVNPRYPVSEMERIRKEVDIMPGGFTDPQTLRAKMLGLDRYLEAKLEAEERDANNRRLSVEDRSNAESSAETIRRFRNILGADRIRQMPAGSSFGGNVIEVDF
jgi:hypothetical protein